MIDAPSPPILRSTVCASISASHVVLASVDLVVPRGSIISVLDGAGKISFLEMPAILLTPDAGAIAWLIGSVSTTLRYLFKATLCSTHDRVGKCRAALGTTTRLGRREIAQAARDALKSLGLRNLRSFSGTDVRRNAKTARPLARWSRAPNCCCLTTDSRARSASTQRHLRNDRSRQAEFDFTAVVTRRPEALAASDRVALLEDGQIHFEGTPAEFAASDDALCGFSDNIVTLGPASTNSFYRTLSSK
jgi:phospholipid/cholesterol/gamma-HCH transport system ATP-binding protein